MNPRRASSKLSRKITSSKDVIEFLSTLQTLGFDDETQFEECHLKADDQVFTLIADNMKAFGNISHFLLCQLNKEKAQTYFKHCWPLDSESRIKAYKKVAFDWLIELRAACPTLKRVLAGVNSLDACRGEKINQILMAISKLASEKDTTKYKAGGVTLNKMMKQESKQQKPAVKKPVVNEDQFDNKAKKPSCHLSGSPSAAKIVVSSSKNTVNSIKNMPSRLPRFSAGGVKKETNYSSSKEKTVIEPKEKDNDRRIKSQNKEPARKGENSMNSENVIMRQQQDPQQPKEEPTFTIPLQKAYDSVETYKTSLSIMNSPAAAAKVDPFYVFPPLSKPDPITTDHLDSREIMQEQSREDVRSTHTPAALPSLTSTQQFLQKLSPYQADRYQIPTSEILLSPTRPQPNMIFDESSSTEVSTTLHTPTLSYDTVLKGGKRSRSGITSAMGGKSDSKSFDSSPRKRLATAVFYNTANNRPKPHRAVNYLQPSKPDSTTLGYTTTPCDKTNQKSALSSMIPSEPTIAAGGPTSSPRNASTSRERRAPAQARPNYHGSNNKNINPNQGTTTIISKTAKQPLQISPVRNYTGRTMLDQASYNQQGDDDELYLHGLKSVQPIISEQPPLTIDDNITPLLKKDPSSDIVFMSAVSNIYDDEVSETFYASALEFENPLDLEEAPSAVFYNNLTPARK